MSKATVPDLTVNVRQLYSKLEYSRAYNISRPTIDRMIERKQLLVVPYNGGEVIVAPMR